MNALAIAIPRSIDEAAQLPLHQIAGLQSYIPQPQESHHLFGAGFLFVGVLLIVEAISGSVWHRSRIRTLIWPGTIIGLGFGMLVVTGLDTDQRPVHFTIGLIMIAAGWIEARHRLGELPRRTADLWVVPALVLGAVEIGVFHFHGAWDNTGTVHILMGITTLGLVAGRVLHSRDLTSVPRHALVGVFAMALALELMAVDH